ncbi:hypothetical protein QDD82_006272 [Burkholderia cepacia]|uniref:Uncharacterized protein n=3 Tax=Burkholderia cepacia complex TaxID=87882 RepID=A0A427NM09_9BURK|nr:conserved hypothetical protein [Burkholderia cenocepacia HI2424]AQQ24271.1 hypothetical protein A8E88_00600 [Burkholderia cenocepacia]EKS9845404.1 hypothetical protein [Burkholderia cepacia]MBL3966571.1 hypothetical protein [Burkholderia sp. KCJ3K979]MBJ9666810.1 hypothetical protein [Burkholderia cenocepacia]
MTRSGVFPYRWRAGMNAPNQLAAIPKCAAPSRFRPRPPGPARQIPPKCITSHSSDEKNAPVPGMMRTLRSWDALFLYAFLMREKPQIRTKAT